MKTKPLVLVCWIVVVLATFHVALNITSLLTRPWLGFDYSRETGMVTDVVPAGPAAAAGLLEGDRILRLDGQSIVPGGTPLYRAQEGVPVAFLLERNGRQQSLAVEPVTQEQMRREQLRHGGRAAMLAVNHYLSIPLHVWMMLVAATLLVKRPGNKDARLAALAFSSWAGGFFMHRLAGFGVVIESMPPVTRSALMLTDAFLVAGFFAFCLHFALVFPSERVRLRRGVAILPYLLASPIFIEVAANGLRRARHDLTPAPLPWFDAYSRIGSFMLLLTLLVVGTRWVRMKERNPRRRLQLIVLALLPGSAAFIAGFLVPLLGLPYEWQAVSTLLHTPAVIAGSVVFTYATIRHRMFNMRVLARRSLQYALARGTLLTLLSLPAAGLVLFLYAHRSESLLTLLTGQPAAYALILLPLAAAVRYRRRLLEALDRRFFREQYDARRVLQHVVSIIRGGSDMMTVSRAALDEIERALHPTHLSLWQLDGGGEALYRGFSRAEGGDDRLRAGSPLRVGGMLATLLTGRDEPLDVYSRQTREVLRRLPDEDRQWLRDTDAHLLVPLLIDGKIIGALVLGGRRSEEPYGGEDRELLRTLGAQLALTLDYARLKQSPSLVWESSGNSAPLLQLRSSDAVRLCSRCGRCYPASEARCDADDQPLTTEPGVPQVIEDKYVVTRLLGRGGMGTVYLATQRRLNRPVAIKVLLSHLVGSSTMRGRFEREARIVARLRHPSIVTIHDFGVLPSGHAYLVMEYLDGMTLRKTIAGGRQSVGEAISLVARVGDAVDAAHRVGVVHRDLKPENIMIVRDHEGGPSPRVLDFGLARMTTTGADDDATLVQSTHSGGVVGTLMYMAPEILSGHAADSRADQYSLAIIAYELLAGEHPLGRATDLASVVRGHTETPLISIRERVSDVPPRVAETIHRALAKQPSARFESVAAFVGALRA